MYLQKCGSVYQQRRQDARDVISIKHIPRDAIHREPNSQPRNIDVAALSGFACLMNPPRSMARAC